MDGGCRFVESQSREVMSEIDDLQSNESLHLLCFAKDEFSLVEKSGRNSQSSSKCQILQD
jgi:hypothetical protein